MKTVRRDKIRGKKLDHDCHNAKTSRYEYGPDDPRVYCYGLYDDMSDDIRTECVKCKAFVSNAEPPKEG